MDDDKITILKEKFINESNGEEVDGITIMIDGKLKDVLDLIKSSFYDVYDDYSEVVKDALFEGINILVDNINKKIKRPT